MAFGLRLLHFGKDSVASADLNALIQICRTVVLVLLSSKELKDVDTMIALAERFRARKDASIEANEGS
jgi:hypothetical protein